MPVKLSDLVIHLEALAPPATAEAWDNVGLLVGDAAADISRVLLCIDYTTAVAAEAKTGRADLVIAYHPPIFRGFKRVTAGGESALVFDAIRSGIAIYSPHTALDVADGGTNDVLADVIGLTERRPLRSGDANAATGIGRVGTFTVATSRAEIMNRVRSGLGIDQVLLAGPTEAAVRTVAICAGAGGDLLDNALAAKADLYLTGELRHHDALRAAAAGMTVLCTLHSNSERVTLRHLAKRLRSKFADVTFSLSTADRDPFQIN